MFDKPRVPVRKCSIFRVATVAALALLLAFTVAVLHWGWSLQSAVVTGTALAAVAARFVTTTTRRRRGR